MKIIILGVGETGTSVAKRLAKEGHDVVVVDQEPVRLQELQDRVDIATVTGTGTHPETLEQAGADSADLLIAVMTRDEDNMVACQMAWSLFHLPLKVARIRDTDFLGHGELYNPTNVPIDVIISPEMLVTRYIQNLIEYPGANFVYEFAEGAARLVSVTVQINAGMCGCSVRELHARFPKIRVVGIISDNGLLLPTSDSLIKENYQVFYVAPPQQVIEVMQQLRQREDPYRRVILAGGGHIGKRLALALQNKFKIKIIEKSTVRAAKIAPLLEKTIVLGADATDRDLLVDEGIADTEVFCALTCVDEANILSSMLAKRLGAQKTLCLVNKPDYVDMIQGGVIDVAFSPDKITAGSILRYVRRGHVEKVYPLLDSGAEVMEAVAEGKAGESKLVGLRVDQVDLRSGVVLGAIVRDGEMIEVHHDIVIKEDDHLIMLLQNESLLNKVASHFLPVS